jgi:hypothetical protein
LSGAAAKVLIQYTYDAYGQPITAEDLTSSPPGRTPGGNLSPSAAGNSSGASATGGGDIYSHATNRLGHKGLFFDRLDGRPGSPTRRITAYRSGCKPRLSRCWFHIRMAGG